MIDNIKDSSVVDGCGCYFQFPSENKRLSRKFVFLADLNEGDAWMNVDGRDISLKLTDWGRDPKRNRVGARRTRTYEGSGVIVRVNYLTTSVCKPDDESCESIGYNATFTVTKGDAARIVKAKGGCGC